MKKGQLISLDLIISLIVVILGIGLLLQFNEARIYSQKDEIMQKELETIGKTASMLLVSNPDIVCELEEKNGTVISFLENCIDTTKTIDKISLGIPNAYSFGVFEGSTTLYGVDISTDAKNVFVENRSIVVQNGKLTKAELEKCMKKDRACPLVEKTVTIAVWRAVT